MDAVAATFVDLVLSREALPNVLNLVHPRGISWHKIFNDINEHLNPALPLVPFREWLGRLELLADNAGPDELAAVVSHHPQI